MGAFNTVAVTTRCPNCSRTAEFEVQFKYGDTWQYAYKMGEELRWGGNDIGTPGRSRVLVEGIGGPCPHCHVDGLDFDVVIESDRLVGIEPLRGGRTTASSEGFVVLKP